jgi:hypothetical protein
MWVPSKTFLAQALSRVVGGLAVLAVLPSAVKIERNLF